MSVFMTLIIGISSCKNDNDKIIGKWQINKISDTNGFRECHYQGWMEFRPDGEFVEYDKCNNATIEGKWHLDKIGKLTIVQFRTGVPRLDYDVKKLSNRKLVIQAETLIKLFGEEPRISFKKI